MFRPLACIAALLCFSPAIVARTLVATPSEASALEFVEIEASLSFGCERLAEVSPDSGGFTLTFARNPATQCDRLGTIRLTLGAFPPGSYRVRSLVTTPDSTPPSQDGETTIVVRAGPRASDPYPTQPQVDLSGIWTTPSEPFTGFALIHSAEPAPAPRNRAERITGLWYDYSSSQPTWTMLLLDGTVSQATYQGQVVRTVATGSGTTRTVAMPTIGTASLARDGEGRWRLTGNIDGRNFDLPLERFRWTRAAWPTGG